MFNYGSYCDLIEGRILHTTDSCLNYRLVQLLYMNSFTFQFCSFPYYVVRFLKKCVFSHLCMWCVPL